MAEVDPTSILLIGAGGQLGSELRRALPRVGHVVGAVRPHGGKTTLADCVPLDLTDHDALRALVRQTRPQFIVNAAAYTAVDRAESEVEQAMAVNAAAPAVLASEAQRIGAGLVHFSTDYVFNGEGQRAWREDDSTGSLNAYGHSKLAGEEAIRASGAAHLIVRTSWLYGAVGHNFVKIMLRLGAERDEIRVVNDQIGSPTAAAVVAELIAEILTVGISEPVRFLRERGGTLHLACGGETSWHGFAEEIFRLARAARIPLKVARVTPIPSVEYPLPARRPFNSRLDCTRLWDQFALKAPSWQAALAQVFPDIVAGTGQVPATLPA